MLRLPDDGISVEVSCWVKPEIELLFPVSLALSEHIGMYNIRVAGDISQEFEVYFVVSWPLRRQLQ